MNISREQKTWLESRGGRNIDDVIIHNNVPCVEMWDGENKQSILIAIPESHNVRNTIFGLVMFNHMMNRFT